MMARTCEGVPVDRIAEETVIPPRPAWRQTVRRG